MHRHRDASVSFATQAIPQGFAVHGVGIHLAWRPAALVGRKVFVEAGDCARLVDPRGPAEVPLSG